MNLIKQLIRIFQWAQRCLSFRCVLDQNKLNKQRFITALLTSHQVHSSSIRLKRSKLLTMPRTRHPTQYLSSPPAGSAALAGTITPASSC